MDTKLRFLTSQISCTSGIWIGQPRNPMQCPTKARITLKEKCPPLQDQEASTHTYRDPLIYSFQFSSPRLKPWPPCLKCRNSTFFGFCASYSDVFKTKIWSAGKFKPCDLNRKRVPTTYRLVTIACGLRNLRHVALLFSWFSNAKDTYSSKPSKLIT